MDALRKALRLAFLDILAIFIASALGAGIVLVCFEYEFYSGFVAYVAAIILTVLGIYFSKKLKSDVLAHLVNVFVVSLVCISVTFSATQILAGYIARYLNEITNKGVIDFIIKYAPPGSEHKLLIWTVLGSFGVVLANRLGNEFFKDEQTCYRDLGSLTKVCLFIQGLTSFPTNIISVCILLVASILLMFVFGDVTLLAAVGGPIAIIGLFSTVKFTTIEKYLNRDQLAANSTGTTGPPIAEADYEAIVSRNQEAARKRLALELRAELTGLGLTVFGTILWAYGAYLPISWLGVVSHVTN